MYIYTINSFATSFVKIESTYENYETEPLVFSSMVVKSTFQTVNFVVHVNSIQRVFSKLSRDFEDIAETSWIVFQGRIPKARERASSCILRFIVVVLEGRANENTLATITRCACVLRKRAVGNVSDSRVDCTRKATINQRREGNWYSYSGSCRFFFFFHVRRRVEHVHTVPTDGWAIEMRHRD